MKTLYHLCTDAKGEPKDGAFVDGNGFKYVIPYDLPTDIERDFMADKIVEHLHYFGIVEVYSTRDRAGVHFDMEDARNRALTSLEISEKECIDQYVRTQLEDRVRMNYPALPPMGRAMECVIKHKVNLLKYGLQPVGWSPPYQPEPLKKGEAVPTATGGPSDLIQRLTQLETTILQQQQLIMELLTPRRAKVGVEAEAPRPEQGQEVQKLARKVKQEVTV